MPFKLTPKHFGGRLMKSICKLSKKDLARFLPELCSQLQDCRYVCRKCGRVAPKKERLCKPSSLSKVAAQGEIDHT
jgi:hypothetical protein